MKHLLHSWVALPLLHLAIPPALVSGATSPATQPPVLPDAAVLAWVRFPDAAQQYAGLPYRFLGDGSLDIDYDVPPAPGLALDLLWGCKADQRTATIKVNGRTVPASGGAFQGFRWLRFPLPEDLVGERCRVQIEAGGLHKAAFLAEVRLVAPGAAAPAPVDLSLPRHRASLSIRKAPLVVSEAFPGMRPFWDQPSPAVQHSRPVERLAERNARQAHEALFRSRRFIDGWLANADPGTGLIPRNLEKGRDFWNGRDAAADNYPFMVLTAAVTDRPLFEGRMLDMLRTETRLTSRVDRLPDDYSFSKKGWRKEDVDLDAIIFDGAEYVKDGLLPITEWLGASPWSERALGIIDDIWKHAPVETPFGNIPTRNFEVNGDLLQACSRLFWFTGQRKYLDWAIRLGDYYLLGDQHPTRDLPELKLGDHSCEVINGLSELYAACAKAEPLKREAYRKPLHELYDRLLEIARNEHGLLYLQVNTQTGEHGTALTDNWGYNYDGLYTVFLLDGTTAYRDAVRQVLSQLKEHYTGQGGMCQSNTADGYADSIEGAITLFNREPVASAAEWIDAEIKTMWGRQQPDGVIEGWHGDGNSARTSLMYALWKTQGVTAQPWRPDLRFGAVLDDGTLHVLILADQPWEGRILFDTPRHQSHMHLPLDYPRINQFPEWFTAHEAQTYEILSAGKCARTISGSALRAGLPLTVVPGQPSSLQVSLRSH